MTTDVIIVKLGNKRIDFIRTESGRFFDITCCQPVTDNKYGTNRNGLLSGAKQVSSQYVADLVAKAENQRLSKVKVKVKASSKSKNRSQSQKSRSDLRSTTTQQTHQQKEVYYNQ